MIEMKARRPTLCDCTVEIAEMLASMPAAGIDDGSLFDLLPFASRHRVTV